MIGTQTNTPSLCASTNLGRRSHHICFWAQWSRGRGREFAGPSLQPTCTFALQCRARVYLCICFAVQGKWSLCPQFVHNGHSVSFPTTHPQSLGEVMISRFAVLCSSSLRHGCVPLACHWEMLHCPLSGLPDRADRICDNSPSPLSSGPGRR